MVTRNYTVRKYEQHGQTKTRRYRIWKGIKQRCLSPSYKQYPDYGGRGIGVCKDWAESFVAFFDWSEASGYGDDLEVDRIDNSKGYSPDNCRWATPKTNANNRRNNHNVTAFGETKTITAWTEDVRCACDINALLHRLRKGWESEAAITTPQRKRKVS